MMLAQPGLGENLPHRRDHQHDHRQPDDHHAGPDARRRPTTHTRFIFFHDTLLLEWAEP